MPASSPDRAGAFQQLIGLLGSGINSHVAKVRCEHDDGAEPDRAVRPLWDRLVRPPLREDAARRMAELLGEALPSRTLRCATEVRGDLALIVTVVPAFEDADARHHFAPGATGPSHSSGRWAGVLVHDRWTVHWTACTDGLHTPRIHLSVLPPPSILEAGRALILWR